MACGCGKTTPQQNYEYTAPDGTKKTYTSEVQAQAAKIRGGGSYAPVPR